MLPHRIRPWHCISVVSAGIVVGFLLPDLFHFKVTPSEAGEDPSAGDRLVAVNVPREPASSPEELAALHEHYQSKILPILETYCYDCHGDGLRRGDLALDDYLDIAEMRANRDAWERIRSHLDFRLMPPLDRKQPADEDFDAVVAWIDAAVFPVDPDNPDPGRVTVRRLNRFEYVNTLRDLLGVEIDPDRLPPDDSGYGFDHIGDVLTLAPTHLDRYQEIAHEALLTATQPRAGGAPLDISGERMRGGNEVRGEARGLYTNGAARAWANVPASGTYRIILTLSGDQAGDEPAKAAVRVNGNHLGTLDVANQHPTTREFELEGRIERGRARVEIDFVNDFYREMPGRNLDRNLFVHHVRIEGPAGAPEPERPDFHQRWFADPPPGVDPLDHAVASLSGFMRLAFRRSIAAEEVARYRSLIQSFVEEGDEIPEALLFAMEAVLLSPDFLFRELAAVSSEGEPGSVELISEFDLATRLAYFIWSSKPDERLLDLAERGRLRDELSSEVDRMLADSRADALVDNFFLQWLRVRDIDVAQPDLVAFPDFGSGLRRSMRDETREFCRHLLRENLPVTVMLDAEYTFVDRTLARYYGIEHPGGNSFEQVSLAGTGRRGILTHASVLTLTSHPTRTSPVKRGEWVLDVLLDTTPPPPPPNVPSLESQTTLPDDAPLRDRLEAHRADPSCSACHALMDGIGYAFEHYDAIGRWRERDGANAVDPRGSLVSGETFSSPHELVDVLLSARHKEFVDSFASRLLTFALGRGVYYYDRPAIERIAAHALANELRAHQFIHAVVQSAPFQYRRLPLDEAALMADQSPREGDLIADQTTNLGNDPSS